MENELVKEYILRLSKTPAWELTKMKRALESLGGFFNDDEENARLEAVKILLKRKKD